MPIIFGYDLGNWFGDDAPAGPVYGPQNEMFDPFTPTPEHAAVAVAAVQQESGDAAATAVANALEEAKTARKRKVANVVLSACVIALAITVVVVIWKSLKK